MNIASLQLKAYQDKEAATAGGYPGYLVPSSGNSHSGGRNWDVMRSSNISIFLVCCNCTCGRTSVCTASVADDDSSALYQGIQGIKVISAKICIRNQYRLILWFQSRYHPIQAAGESCIPFVCWVVPDVYSAKQFVPSDIWISTFLSNW